MQRSLNRRKLTDLALYAGAVAYVAAVWLGSVGACTPKYDDTDHRRCCACMAGHYEFGGDEPEDEHDRRCIVGIEDCTQALTTEGVFSDVDLRCPFAHCEDACGYLEPVP